MGYDNQAIIQLARKAIEEIVINDNEWFPSLTNPRYKDMLQKQGAFTTIYNQDENRSLRGCIGVPYPEYPLAEAIAISARNTASKDPRFPPVTIEELAKIDIEVEVLSPIIQIQFVDRDDLLRQIEVGNHGLIVKFQGKAGLLLPKVGERYSWTSLELVENTCRKAMLPQDAYTWDEIEVYKFTSDLYYGVE